MTLSSPLIQNSTTRIAIMMMFRQKSGFFIVKKEMFLVKKKNSLFLFFFFVKHAVNMMMRSCVIMTFWQASLYFEVLLPTYRGQRNRDPLRTQTLQIVQKSVKHMF